MTERQTNAAATLIGLSPLLYLVPGAQARALGGAAWIGCLGALPVLALFGWLLKKRPVRTPGRLAAAGLALWLMAAAAAVLHGCAARYSTAVGVFRSPIPYAVLLLLTAVPAALSRKKALFRASEVFLPVVLALLGVVLLCAAKQLRPARLIDLTSVTLPNAARAALPVCCVGLAALVLPRVYAGAQPGAAPGIGLAGIAGLLCAAAVSALGAPMTAQLALPVFTLLRNLSLLHTVERLDALMAAVWILPDVTLLALLLRAGGDSAARALALPQGRAPVLVTAALAAGGAVLINAQGQGFPERFAPVLAGGLAAIALLTSVQKRA